MQLAIIGDFSKYKSKSFQDLSVNAIKVTGYSFSENQKAALEKLTSENSMVD